MTFSRMNTTPEMAQQAAKGDTDPMNYMTRATEALILGAPAFERLIIACEQGFSGQPRKIARFLGACWNGQRHFDLSDLRAVDRDVSDDMLLVLDAHRWGAVALEKMVPDGDARIVRILKSRGMYGDGQRGQAIVREE